MYFPLFVMHYASTPAFLSTGGLNSHTCIHGNRGVLSGTTRKQVFWTPEGLAASISTEPFCPSEEGFSHQITSDRVQTSHR